MATAESVKGKIEGLISKANAKTGASDKTLTGSINRLVAGYSGGTGSTECSGKHIIEVDELPETGEEGVVYKCGDSFYQWVKEFKDIITLQSNGDTLSFVGTYEALGTATFVLYYVKTKPTENIQAVDQTTMPMIFPFYYVEDEDNIFLYGDSEGTGTNEWVLLTVISEDLTYQGVITDASEATVVDGIYALVSDGWKEYLAPSGSIAINKKGTYNVSQYVNAIVEVPSSYMVQTTTELPTDASDGSLAIVLRG
jgi:hypothetical protein